MSNNNNEDVDLLESGKKQRPLFQTPAGGFTYTPGGRTPQQSDPARRISDQFTPKSPFTTQQRSRYANALPSILKTSTKSSKPLQQQPDPDVEIDEDDVDADSLMRNASRGRDGTQRSKFVREEDLGEEFMFEVDVTLRKQDYGEPG